jgi:tol-pal system protein YbgF
MRARVIAAAALAALMALPLAASANEPSLADLRSELTSLRSQFQELRAQLVASGAAGFQAVGGDAAIDRMNAMEQRLAQLTNHTEQLQNKINRILDTGNRRLNDLEFRLCEMDETCDLGALTMPPADVGAQNSAAVAPAVPPATTQPGKAATAAEQADFDAANAVMATGDFRRAAEMFGAVAENHAGGPLTAEALYLRGAALDSAGEARAAAAAWLEGFAADPDGPRAAESLLGIARVIEADGDSTAACLYLAEIPARFSGSSQAAEAETRMSRLACGANDLDTALPPEGLDPEAAADLSEYE